MKREKEIFLDEIREQIDRSQSFIIANYDRLSAEQAYQFRREVQKTGGYFEVVRKRMFVQAANRLGMDFDIAHLPGHIGLVLGSEDAIQAAKTVLDFNKKEGDLFQLLGGYVDGQRASKEEVEQLARLPGKDQMRAQLLSLFTAPMSGIVGLFDSLVSSVVRCVDQRCRKEGG